MKRVIVESPYAADTQEGIERHLRYLRACLHDCIKRDEAPFASHAIYTQPGVLDDRNPDECSLGIESGFLWRSVAQYTVVYTDLGITRGMRYGIQDAARLGHKIEYRKLDDIWDVPHVLSTSRWGR
jgi:hypothetical protein